MSGLKQLAIKAGMYYREIEDEFCEGDKDGVPMQMLETFAALVAAAEREACAKLFDGEVWAYDYREIAAAIRNRGNNAA